MAIAQRLLGSGLGAQAAANIVGDVDPAITATGSTQGTAYQLFAANSLVTTAASGTGVIVPVMNPGDSILIKNEGANTLSVYPRTGENINALSANSAYSLSAATAVQLTKITNTKYISELSAG